MAQKVLDIAFGVFLGVTSVIVFRTGPSAADNRSAGAFEVSASSYGAIISAWRVNTASGEMVLCTTMSTDTAPTCKTAAAK